MHTITLTNRELEIIRSALETVSPVGGGSCPYTLLRKLPSMPTNELMVMGFCNNVIDNAVDADVVVRT